MKPNLKELNLEKLKKIAAKTPRIRVKLTRKHWIFIGCAVVVLVVLLVVLLRPRPQAAALPVVAVEPVQVEDVSIYGEYVGRIRARVEGYLEKMLFAEGTYIKKGQTLFIIDPTVYRARANKAKAQLNKARAQAL